MPFGSTVANEILDALFNNDSYVIAQAYVSLHTADPGATGASEVAGGSYARQAYNVDAAAAKAVSNNAAVTFTGMPATTVTHVGLWDANAAGNFIHGGILTASKTFGAGDIAEFPTGDLDVSLT